MYKKGKLTWYEVALEVVPDKADIRHNYFYVTVSRWEEWEEFGNNRYTYDPFIGNYMNRQEYFRLTHGRDDVTHIVVADTLMTLEEALALEEYLVKGLRSTEKQHGFNKKVGE